MNFSTYRFTLDLQKHQSQMSIAAFHYDTAIKLSIGLTDGGVPYYLEDGCIAVLWGTRADGSPISHKCSIENNTRIIYEFNNETAKITGVVNCQIRLYKDGEEIITAPKFIIVVAERLVNDTDILDAEDDVFTHDQLSALDGLFVNESARAEAEKARVEAENVRDGNERLRDEKEQTRIAFENERQIKEAKREIAETKREQAYEGKVDKTTEAYKVYGTDAKGQAVFDWSYEANGNTIARRILNGHISVPLKPTEGKNATSKEYVDRLVNPLAEKQTEIEKKVADLESLTLTFTEETSTDYEKVVPAEVGKYALVKMIGGATERVNGKNLLDSNAITFESPMGYDIKTVYNAEGTITYTVSTPSCYAYIDLTPFPVGKYYLYFEGAAINSPHFSGSTIEIDCQADFDANAGEYGDYLKTTRTLKVMLWQDTSVTTEEYEIAPAPEGTVFEPYTEPYLVNADVEKIESIGKNRLPSDVYDALKWVKEAEQNYSIYPLEFLSDGWYCISLKLKKGYDGTVYCHLQKSIDGGKSYVYDDVGYNASGVIRKGYWISNTGMAQGTENLDGSLQGSIWFKVDNKAGIIYRLWFNAITQSKLDWIYDMQIEKVNLAQEPSNSYKPSVYAPATAYSPYKADAIDTIVIPEELRTDYDGYGIDGSSVDFEDDKVSLTQRKNITTFPTNSTWRVNKEFDNHISFSMNKSALSPQMKGTLDASLDCFEFEVKGWMSTLEGAEFAWYTASELGICINKSRLIPYGELVDITSAVNAFKAWLSDNPVGIKYELAEPIVTDITHLFTEDNAIEVEGHGVLRFVNEHEIAVPSTAQYVTRKG